MTSQNPNPAAIIDRLERFIETFPAIVSAFHPDDIAWKPDPESWSVLEIVCHMADEEAEDFPARVFLTLNDPSLDWPPIDPEGWAISRDYRSQELQTQLNRWVNLRKQSIKALRTIENPDWSRTKHHKQLGSMVALELLAAWSAHDALHMRQLARRLHQLASRDAVRILQPGMPGIGNPVRVGTMIAKKYILRIFLALVVLAMLTGIAAVLLPSGWIDDRVLVSIFIVGAYSLGGIIIVAAAPKHGKQQWTLRICTSGLLFSMSVFIAFIWLEQVLGWEYEEYFWKPAFIALIVGIAATHRLMIVPLKNTMPWFRAIKRSALISASVTVLLISIGIVLDGFWYWDELVVRIIAVTSIVAAGSTIACGALAVFALKPGEDEQSSFNTSLPVQLTCPRCHGVIDARTNKDSRCPSCKLKVRIEIEEPRCDCGYLLYQLQSDTCPECGKAVPESEQWGSAASGSSAERSASVDHDQTPSS